MDTPLKCTVEGTDLVMRIGIGTLAFAAKKRNGGPIANRVRIANKAQLAKDVAYELMREDGVGDYPMARLLDQAIEAAAEMGSTAFDYPREQRAKPTPCDGCGATHPRERCIGCMHEFYPQNANLTGGTSGPESCSA